MNNYNIKMIRQQPIKHINRHPFEQNNSISLEAEGQDQIESELRLKVRNSNRQNQVLRQQMANLQLSVKQLHQSENNLIVINRQLRQKNNQINQSLDEWKKRTSVLKEELAQSKPIKEQLEMSKKQIIQLKLKNQQLEQEKKKIIQISIDEKMNLQQKWTNISMNKLSNDQYQLKLETELCKSKQTIFRLEAQIKKQSIQNDEDKFNKKWSQENLQKEYYQKTIKQMESKLNELKDKMRKDKEKKAQLEGRIAELQERTGFLNVKAEAYEGQISLLQKKMSKMSRGMSQAKMTSNMMTNEKTNWQQKFNKTVHMCQELISRIKRQLVGSAVQLAKSCEFRLNKLKQYKLCVKPDQAKPNAQRKCASSNKKVKNEKQSKDCLIDRPEEQFGRILSQMNSNKTKQQTIKSKQSMSATNILASNKQEDNLQNELNNLETKVRRERDLMEKKLKEKMLYRQLQVSSSPQKSKLRSDYLNLIFQK